MESGPDLRLISQEDNLFAGGHYPRQFCFNSEVASVFDDMISRSIPLYRDVIHTCSDLAKFFYKNETHIIDIGCSTGTATHHIAFSLEQGALLLAIDNSAAMIARAKHKLEDIPKQHKLTLLCADVMHCSLPNASVIIVNYTLQFLPIVDRIHLLSRIHKALIPGGILILSEKVRSTTPIFQKLATEGYEKFKEMQGYSRTEIERKKEALDKVLIPFTEAEHRTNLAHAGFSAVDSLLKSNNFLTLIALKDKGS